MRALAFGSGFDKSCFIDSYKRGGWLGMVDGRLDGGLVSYPGEVGEIVGAVRYMERVSTMFGVEQTQDYNDSLALVYNARTLNEGPDSVKMLLSTFYDGRFGYIFRFPDVSDDELESVGVDPSSAIWVKDTRTVALVLNAVGR